MVFVSAHLLSSKRWSFRYSPGWGNPLCWFVVLSVGGVQRGNNATCLALGQLSITSPATHKQTGFVYLVGLCGSLQRTLL